MPESAQDAVIDDGTPRQQRMTRRGGKSRSIHVYLKPGMREDDLLIAVWDAISNGGRPQDGYRRLLLEGVKRMVENGDMPLSIMKDPKVARHIDVLGDLDQLRRPVVVMAPQGYQAGPLPGQAAMPPAPVPVPRHPPPPAAPVSAAPADARPGAKPKRKGLDPNLM